MSRKRKSIAIGIVLLGNSLVVLSLFVDLITTQHISIGPAQVSILLLSAVISVGGVYLYNNPVDSRNIGLLGLSIVGSLILFEGGIRVVGNVDQDGQFTLRAMRLMPYQHEVSRTESLLNAYYESDSPFIIYDENLGWVPAPDGLSQNGYTVNSVGIRSEQEYPLTPPENGLRIATFGDSFTFGDQILLAETWPTKLEVLISSSDLPAEVLNFGVGGYGTDQAYLRYTLHGVGYQPDIVVLGFQPENIQRNVNIIRSIYVPATGNPFSKPRFIVDADGALTLINSPTIPPENISEVLGSFNESDLSAYEYHLDRAMYEDFWWLKSRTLSLLTTPIMSYQNPDTDKSVLYALDNEPAQVTLAIIEAFARDVEAQGARFVVVHLPTQGDIEQYQSGQPLPYQAVIDVLRQEYIYVETLDVFSGLPPSEYFAPGHYDTDGTDVIASEVVDTILMMLPSLED